MKKLCYLIIIFISIISLTKSFAMSTANTLDITVNLETPDPSWSITIDEIYQVEDEIWVISNLHTEDGFWIQVISQAVDCKVVHAHDLPIRYFIFGKKWNWKNKEPYVFLDDRKELDPKLKYAKVIYKKQLEPLENQAKYIVSYKRSAFKNRRTKDGETLEILAKRHMKEIQGVFLRILRGINGFIAILTQEAVEKLEELPEINYIKEYGENDNK